MSNPIIIQGGMGVAVSGWRLAWAVATTGQMGVVSGTALAVVQARALQQGDPGGHLRRAFDHFPVPAIAERVWNQFYVPGGIAAGAPFKPTAMPNLSPSAAFIELTVLANFAEVFLAKEGHGGPVGINLLEKIQLPTLPSLYGAMLAGVDYVLMGAGMPRSIPGSLDSLARGEPASMRIDIAGDAPDAPTFMNFDPRCIFAGQPPELPRPQFLAIVSSSALATTLARKSTGPVNGFVVEGSTAGGHNAPPRGAMELSPDGEPIYGPRDLPDISKIRDLGLPFWLAGSCADPHKITDALAAGAAGVQVGTAFALCEESGILPDLKRKFRELIRNGKARIFTDPVASPTGFPFKVAQLAGTLSDAAAYASRARICDLGYLRQLFRRTDGTVGYRCPAEPVADFVHKGGNAADTEGRKCLCNGLTATVGLGQSRNGLAEFPLITSGDDLSLVERFLSRGRECYNAADVIRALLEPLSRQTA
ncbi:MAG TPA: nitronate monooxygenase [Opitutaceae bacterium]